MGISALTRQQGPKTAEKAPFLQIFLDVIAILLFLRAEDAYHVLDT
jgi:hypothetical protein